MTLDQALRLAPSPVEKVWGGTRIAERFGGSADQKIGERWEVHGDLQVAEGKFKGRTLDSLVADFGTNLLGTACPPTSTFPLLTKWLDCNAWLSVQVHPDDKLAPELTGSPDSRGKTEAWYICEASSDSKLIHGLNSGVDTETLKRRVDEEWLEICNRRAATRDELLFTPAGTVHALGPGLLLYEVQQSSDLTYRLYDWGRPRPVHPDEAWRCLRECQPIAFEQRGSEYLSCPFFEIHRLDSDFKWSLEGSSFEVLASVRGTAQLSYPTGKTQVAPGDSLVLPAGLGPTELKLEKEARILRIHLPEV